MQQMVFREGHIIRAGLRVSSNIADFKTGVSLFSISMHSTVYSTYTGVNGS